MHKQQIKQICDTVNKQYKAYKDAIEEATNSEDLTEEAKGRKTIDAENLWQEVKAEARRQLLEIFDRVEPRKPKLKDQQLYANTIEEFKHSELLTDDEILNRIKPFTTDSVAMKVLAETVPKGSHKNLILDHNLGAKEAELLEKVKNALINSLITSNEFVENVKFNTEYFGVDLSKFNGSMNLIDDLNLYDIDWSNYE